MQNVIYALGGYDATKPNGNATEVWDDQAGTYTRYNADGTVTETRPLTADEASALAAQEAGGAAALAVTSAQQAVNQLHAAVPDLHAQLAADIATVGAGWDGLTGDQRTAVLMRILNGFGTAMTGLLDHAIVTGSITPT